MEFLDVDAAVTVLVNSVHLIDATDFKTREESVVYNQSGLDLKWVFITTAGVVTSTAVTPTDTAGVYDWTNIGNGYYKIEIPASGGGTINNDAEGYGFFEGFATGILPWRGPTYGFRAVALNNSLVDGPSEKAPATSEEVGTIGTGEGAALNFIATADNSGGTIDPGSTAFVGVETNNYTDTALENGTRHQVADSGNAIDVVYKFSVGGGRTASRLTIHGYATGNNDDLSIRAWDHVGAAWDVIGTFQGLNSAVNRTIIDALLSRHTGSGSELGNVYIRLDGTSLSSSADVNIDQILVAGVSVGQTVGYANGQIWVDTVAGTAGTENFVNGTADNPVLTWADALTLSTSLGLKNFHIANGSTITLTAAGAANFTLVGDNWTLDLAGRAAAGAHFSGANVSGVVTGSGVAFEHGRIGTITVGDDTHFDGVALEAGTITLPAGSAAFSHCYHDAADLPILDFGTGVGSTTVHMHGYNGGIALHNFGDNGTDVMHLDGEGRVDINSNSAGGTLNVRGMWDINDSGASTTINKDDLTADWTDAGRLDALLDLIKVETDKLGDAMPDSVAADGSLNTPIQALYMIQQVLTEMSIVGTTATIKKVDGSTTLITLTLNDGTTPTSITRAT